MVNLSALANSFQGIGQDYDLYRPGFPVEALDMVAPDVVETALDLGAGTGKFTELLVSRARHMTAVVGWRYLRCPTHCVLNTRSVGVFSEPFDETGSPQRLPWDSQIQNHLP